MKKPIIRIATRRSPLAMWQAQFVQQRLTETFPELTVELLPMVTKGDKILDTPLAKVGGKGLFVKELETAILEGRADIAVHSMKDVPVEFPDGLGLAVICEREDPRDAFVSNSYHQIEELPPGAIVGTSSLRRQCQIRERFPDLQVIDLRGNVNTRLSKLDSGDYDAIILAAAGLKRLKMNYRIASYLEPEKSLPAVGQGAVGIECRLDDKTTLNYLSALQCEQTRLRVMAERAMNETLQGGCQVPIGSYAELQGDTLWLRGLVGNPDGSRIIRAEMHGASSEPEQLGKAVADALLNQGAEELLKPLFEDK